MLPYNSNLQCLNVGFHPILYVHIVARYKPDSSFHPFQQGFITSRALQASRFFVRQRPAWLSSLLFVV